MRKLIELLIIAGTFYKIKDFHSFNKDPEDAFLLNLIESSQADFLITGDKALLELAHFGTARILAAKEFEEAVI